MSNKKHRPLKATSRPWNQRIRTDRRAMLRSSIAVTMLVVAGIGIHRHDVNSRELHNLDTIGNGKPVIVQIHDPACHLCRQLMSATKKSLESRPDLVFRVADVTTKEGRALQNEHGAETVVLLMFNARGKLLSSISGVQTPDTLDRVFTEVFGTAPALSEISATSRSHDLVSAS